MNNSKSWIALAFVAVLVAASGALVKGTKRALARASPKRPNIIF